ncbi:MAG: cobaltochelatase subunit CobN [Microcystaceae cyanobacterium]
MHRLASLPGGWTPDTDGVIFVEQTPASVVFLTAADTDIQTLAATVDYLPSVFPSLRCVNLLQLQQPLSIDHYADTVLSHASVIILRLLGGQSYWPYGLEVVKEIVAEKNISLWILPGDNQFDGELMGHSTVSLQTVNQLWQYFVEGGKDNCLNGLKLVSDVCFDTLYHPSPPQEVPRISEQLSLNSEHPYKSIGKVGILFYRSHYLAGNIKPIEALCQELRHKNLYPMPVFITSLRDPDIQQELITYFKEVDLIINTTSFSLAKLDLTTEDEANLSFWKTLNVPVLQAIFSSSPQEIWENSFQGLTPRDVAMNVALPEVDGRIITRAISFKSVETWNKKLETNVVGYQPQLDRIKFVIELAANYIRLKKTPITERKIAIILANYPNKNGRIANGVGLDTPASCVEILNALQAKGYSLLTPMVGIQGLQPNRYNMKPKINLPETGDELIKLLTKGITNDPESKEQLTSNQSLSSKTYQTYFKTLPKSVQTAIIDRWGEQYLNTAQEISIPIAGIQLGNIFIGIQPSRGYDQDPSLNYHAPDLEPTPDYLAYYYWLKNEFKAHGIIHLGKHGNLEWLPGKSLALSNSCYPEITLGTLPHFYPFIVNDPGEGAQAKRRSHGTIIDHLTPPLTRAELYGDLTQLETLIDEYYEAQTLDPSRLNVISDRITQLLQQTNLHQDLGIDTLNNETLPQILNLTDSYLCDLKAAQIRDGLHIFGRCPQSPKLTNLVLSIARFPAYNRLGLTQAIAQDLTLDLDPLTINATDPFNCPVLPPLTPLDLKNDLKTVLNLSDAVDVLETYAKEIIKSLITPLPKTQKVLNWIKNKLLPDLKATNQEITYLLSGLNGEYIPSGASGAPTRGRPDVLPTGKNFYSVDIRAVPTETAWDIGRKAAEVLIERYTQDNGEYPKTLAISIWGTSTMRTGGDDVAQVLALLGVQPIWDYASRRVIDFEILTPSVLGRPRIDVTVRVSGFFRDSFPNLLSLIQNSINAVANQEEDPEINPLAAQVQTEQRFWQDQGLTKEQAKQRATYRIFGSKPGAYGAGLQGLIEAQNWQTEADLARAYLNWSCYAYDQNGESHSVPQVFEKRLKNTQIVVQNQDNREHDILDSDDYYQFQGGLTVATKVVSGQTPTVYLGDNSLPQSPKVRLLKEEINRVYRSRVINPKWIAGVMEHGYKGAFEMAATVDYLFAYDATTGCVEDYLYQGVADAYLLDEKVQQFIQEKNPWVLRDMAERLLEAHQRGLWQTVNQPTLEELRNLVHQGEREIEEHYL